MAELTGLEPATSGVTDRRELQLHHSSMWCRLKDLNPQPPDYKSGALPIELSRQINIKMVGADGIEPPTPCL